MITHQNPRLIIIGLIVAVFGLILFTDLAQATPAPACRKIALTGVVRDVACSPWRCTGTLTHTSAYGYAITVSSPLGDRWTTGTTITATVRTCN
jgi:hypothetical protein